MNRILIVEDDRDIAGNLLLLLKKEGFTAVAVGTREESLEQIQRESFDLVLLDLMLPDGNGYSVCTAIKREADIPVIFLTAMGDEESVVTGFELGADDYIVKPFSNMEVLLRVRALLRRTQQYTSVKAQKEPEISDTQLRYKDLVLDLEEQSVKKGDQVIVLTYTEFRILELFLSHRKKIYSVENIYQSIWEEDAVGDSTIMVHIKNLRKKLGDNSKNPQYIKTAWGKGYYAD